MNDNVEIIRSNKGGMKIIHRGYMYTVHKKRQHGGIRWRCTQRSLHCKGSISTGNGAPTVNMPHNHIPDPHSVALARCRQLEEFADINSLVEAEYEEIRESLMSQFHDDIPDLQMPSSASSSDSSLLQPSSPTKVKTSKPCKQSATKPPEPPEEVCLRWNSHHSNMQTTFPQLLEREKYVDVSIITEGKTLKCHRMILSSCSPYFEDILSDITPFQHPVIILKDISYWILKALIDFMYAGEVNIDQNQLPQLLEIAEVLKVKGLAGNSDSSKQKSESDKPKEASAVEEPPSIAQVEEKQSVDPLNLLEAKFHEEVEPPKPKEVKAPKKTFTKKIRKRKAEEEPPIPMFPMRRGTRSRPILKMPRSYDYDDIVKPAGLDARPFSPIASVKKEPEDDEDLFSDTFTMEMEKLRTYSKVKNTPKSQNETAYKIKVKQISSLSEPKESTDLTEVLNKLPEMEVSVSDLPQIENNDIREEAADITLNDPVKSVQDTITDIQARSNVDQFLDPKIEASGPETVAETKICNDSSGEKSANNKSDEIGVEIGR